MEYENQNVDQVLIINNFVIAHKIDRVHFMDKPHFHDGFEIHFTLTNGTLYQMDERKFMADAGSIALFSSEEIHRVEIDRNKLYERYFILFKPALIQEIIIDSPFLLDIFSKKRKKDCIELTIQNQAVITPLFEELIDLNQKRDNKFNELKLKLKLTELLITLNELVVDELKIHQPVSYEHQQIISEIIQYIKENYYEEVTLDDLSQNFFISKSTIIRSFKKAIGMTPNQFLIFTRIMVSRDFLKQGFSVKQTSEKIGYKDESSFIKKFKELQGESPKQYSMKTFADRGK